MEIWHYHETELRNSFDSWNALACSSFEIRANFAQIFQPSEEGWILTSFATHTDREISQPRCVTDCFVDCDNTDAITEIGSISSLVPLSR